MCPAAGDTECILANFDLRWLALAGLGWLRAMKNQCKKNKFKCLWTHYLKAKSHMNSVARIKCTIEHLSSEVVNKINDLKYAERGTRSGPALWVSFGWRWQSLAWLWLALALAGVGWFRLALAGMGWLWRGLGWL